MIVVSAALKGGVGKTTTSVYLAALAAASNRHGVTLVDADSQGSGGAPAPASPKSSAPVKAAAPATKP